MVRCDGRDIGRIYLGTFATDQRWHWSVSVKAHARAVEGVPMQRLCATLDEAKRAFRASYERMVSTRSP